MFRMTVCRDGRCGCVFGDGMLDMFIVMGCGGGLGLMYMLQVV